MTARDDRDALRIAYEEGAMPTAVLDALHAAYEERGGTKEVLQAMRSALDERDQKIQALGGWIQWLPARMAIGVAIVMPVIWLLSNRWDLQDYLSALLRIGSWSFLKSTANLVWNLLRAEALVYVVLLCISNFCPRPWVHVHRRREPGVRYPVPDTLEDRLR